MQKERRNPKFIWMPYFSTRDFVVNKPHIVMLGRHSEMDNQWITNGLRGVRLPRICGSIIAPSCCGLAKGRLSSARKTGNSRVHNGAGRGDRSWQRVAQAVQQERT